MVLVAAIAVALLIWQISFRADSEAIDRRAPLVGKRTSLVGKRTSGTSDDSSEIPVAPAPGSHAAIEGEDASDRVPSEAAYLERLDRLNSLDKKAALDLAQRGEEWFGESGYLRLVQGVTGIHPRPGPPEHVER